MCGDCRRKNPDTYSVLTGEKGNFIDIFIAHTLVLGSEEI